MMRWKRFAGVIAAVASVAVMALGLPQEAEARGRRGGRPSVVIGGGVYSYPSFWLGYGFGPYYGPYLGPYGGAYIYRPAGGIDMNTAMLAGWGAIDLNVKPGRAEVWVDGKYVAEARDLDGRPSYLWLEEGVHKVTIYKGDYVSFEEEIDVHRGIKKKLKVRLEKGESEPPRPSPQDKVASQP